MGEEEVLQEFIADIEPYIAAVEDGVHAAKEFADANREATDAIDSMRDSAAEDALAERELVTAIHEVRDALLEQAAAARIARDETKNAAQAIDSGGGRGGLVGALASLLGFLGPGGGTGSGGVIGALSAMGPVLLAVAAAGVVLATSALFPILAVLPLIAIGITGFAAVAVPEITKVWHALSLGGSAWAKLSPQEKAAGRELRDIRGEFERLAKSVQPEILRGFDEALKIIKDLMPAIGPLIRAAGRALDTFLGQIDSWLKSGSGQKFIQWMKTDGVGAIKAFGEFLWGLISVLGRTFSFLFNFGETVHRVFDRVRHDVAAAVGQAKQDISNWASNIRAAVSAALSWVEARLAPFTQFWNSHWAEIKQVAKAAWDVISTTVKVAVAILVTTIRVALDLLKPLWSAAWAVMRDTIYTAWTVYKEIVSTTIHVILGIISVVLDLITGHWSQAWADMKKLASDGMNGIVSIIRSIASGFGSLLFDAGRALIDGLIGGIKSGIGALSGVLNWVKSLIPSWKGPLSDDLVLLHENGRAIMQGLINGIGSQLPALRGLLGDVTGSIGAGTLPRAALGHAGGAAAAGGAPAGSGGGNVYLTVNGWVGADQQIALKIRDAILEHGILNPTSGTWPLAKGRIR